mgnify:FL=1
MEVRRIASKIQLIEPNPMVTFNCEVCNATVPKKNTEKHYSRCPEAYYTCIDCSKTFDDGYSYQKHTQCITEDEKYQKALYQGKKKKPQPKVQNPVKVEKPSKDEKPSKVEKPKIEKAKSNDGFPKFEAGSSLYKMLKTVRDKETKKTLLKSLVCNSEGHWVLQ